MNFLNVMPDYMTRETADFLESLRDTNGVTTSTLESIIERAEHEVLNDCCDASEEEIEQARYDYMRFAVITEDIADMYRSGI